MDKDILEAHKDTALKLLESNELEVRKSNTLIDSRHMLNTHQQRVFMLFASKIRRDDHPETRYELSWRELLFVSSGYLDTATKISDLVNDMMSKVVTLRADDGHDESCQFFSWKNNDSNRQVLTVQAHSRLRAELFNLLDHFTLFNLECALNLESTYHLRLYEILKSRQHLMKYIPSFEIDVEDLKWAMGCGDLKTYERWADFKRYILDKAKVAICKSTDISFKYKPVKTGRRITGIECVIAPNPTWQSNILALLPKKPKSRPKEELKGLAGVGSTVLFKGKPYEVLSHGISLPDGSMTLRTINELIKKGAIELV